MKKNIILIFHFLMFARFLAADVIEDRRVESDQVALWKSKLENSKTMDPQAKISNLWLGLRNIGYRHSHAGHSKEIDSLYSEIQSEILAVPNHAQYFENELNQERNALKSGDSKTDYDRKRRIYIAETLVRLPSPETIKVLGSYLFDERDNPPPPNPNHFNDADPVPSSTRLAYESIMDIGLRNPPVTKAAYWAEENDREGYALSRSRAWFNEVKAGERPFSFIGQTVEYRFKPDGTVESTQLPASVLESDPKPPAPSTAATKPRGKAPDVHESPSSASKWSLIVGGILGLAALIHWIRQKRQG
ncbi:hypothetical protein [Luteolibacter yonseiensis]